MGELSGLGEGGSNGVRTALTRVPNYPFPARWHGAGHGLTASRLVQRLGCGRVGGPAWQLSGPWSWCGGLGGL